MSWVRLDDKFGFHPKISGLSDRAFRLHVVGLCHCACYLTDGFLDERALRAVAGAVCDRPARFIRELEQAGVWERQEDGYLVHDYLAFNPSAAQVKDERRKAADRQLAARERKAEERVRHGVTHTVPFPSPSTTPSETVTETSRASGDGGREAVPDLLGEEARAALRRIKQAAGLNGEPL